ncbi:hypothetical protein HYPSUDRAFT_210008 [Hypholoma sublateritium FD-334 SS-4]|uniref:DUF6532 domain-containing protein n=1 Tax=Hypholoma sublateritium (strain FD-334 SS-4) TaxID=945553 RepID=A0A0D2KEE6_HYPSF|nr:hypothetical protein HYPSUDRAFT_210008 [Hypholoma sublateritium FD-334 SS-4]
MDISEKIQGSQQGKQGSKATKSKAVVPEDIPENAMAPIRKTSRKQATKSSIALKTIQAAKATAKVSPAELSNKKLPPPSARTPAFQHRPSTDSRFGFAEGQSANQPAGFQAQRRQVQGQEKRKALDNISEDEDEQPSLQRLKKKARSSPVSRPLKELDIEIDEQSPDEDDRVAQAFLHNNDCNDAQQPHTRALKHLSQVNSVDKSNAHKIPANDSETEDDDMYGPDEATGAEDEVYQKKVRARVQREEEEESEEEEEEEEEMVEEEVAVVEADEEENDEDEEEEEEERRRRHSQRHDADYEELEGDDLGPGGYGAEGEDFADVAIVPAPVDVLAQHHSRNRPVHPPTVDKLAQSAAKQQRQKAQLQNRSQSPEGSAAAEEPNEPQSKKSSTSSGPKIGNYPPGWKSLILIARHRMARHVALFNAFPEKSKHLKAATLIISNLIEEYRKDGKELEPECSHDRNMDSLVFDKHSLFRQNLKNAAKSIVPGKYSYVVEPDPDNECHNQLALYKRVQDCALEQLDKAVFVRSRTLDENGKTQNVAHPAIKALIHKFFYSGTDCLAKLFPDDFAEAVPDHVIALTITCIHNCLEEYAQDGTGNAVVNWEGCSHRKVMASYIKLIKDLKQAEYHGVRYEERRVEWAEGGMRALNYKSTDENPYRPALVLD